MTKRDGSLVLLLAGGICSLMIAMGIGRFAYTPILPLMQTDLGFSDAWAGYLASSNYAGYFLGAVLIGFLPVKKRKVLYLRSGLAASIATTGMMGLTHSFALMLAIRFLSGLASALIFVLASSIVLDRLAQAGKTGASGYLYSGVGLGIICSTLFIPWMNTFFMWDGVWIGLSLLSGLLAVFIWLWIKDSPDNLGHHAASKPDQPAAKEPKAAEERKANARASSRKALPWLAMAYGLEGLGYIVTGTFIVSIADKASTFTANSSVVWILVGLGAIPSCIIWAALAKTRGYVRSLVLAMVVQAIGIAMPVFWLNQTGIMISALLFGATFMGITTLATTLARQMSPANSSRIIGFLTAVYGAGQMAGPAIAGFLMTHTQSFHAALLGAAGSVFAGAVLLAIGLRLEQGQKHGLR
jgi:predicted MFS family arabinose efflux permease